MTAKKTTPTESDLRETIENLGEITRGQLRDFEDHYRRARKFVEKNPVVAVAGVFVLIIQKSFEHHEQLPKESRDNTNQVFRFVDP